MIIVSEYQHLSVNKSGMIVAIILDRPAVFVNGLTLTLGQVEFCYNPYL
jgi:hypothetical protein